MINATLLSREPYHLIFNVEHLSFPTLQLQWECNRQTTGWVEVKGSTLVIWNLLSHYKKIIQY